jgi:hypothetical protein
MIPTTTTKIARMEPRRTMPFGLKIYNWMYARAFKYIAEAALTVCRIQVLRGSCTDRLNSDQFRINASLTSTQYRKEKYIFSYDHCLSHSTPQPVI